MFQKFGATIVDEEKVTQKPVKAAAPKIKLATKVTAANEQEQEERAHYECFRF